MVLKIVTLHFTLQHTLSRASRVSSFDCDPNHTSGQSRAARPPCHKLKGKN